VVPAGIRRDKQRRTTMSDRDETASVQLKVRMDEGLRAQLEVSSRQHGLSLNREVTRRLTLSFSEDDRTEVVFGRPEVFGIMGAVATAMHLAASVHLTLGDHQRTPDAHWLNHGAAFDAALQTATFLLETLDPDHREYSMRWQPFTKATLLMMGLAAANETLDRIGTQRTEFIDGARSALERLSDRLRSEAAK
jgi:hypothetical protein